MWKIVDLQERDTKKKKKFFKSTAFFNFGQCLIVTMLEKGLFHTKSGLICNVFSIKKKKQISNKKK